MVNYTFNGYGEYWMVNSQRIYLQSRMRPLDSNRKATIISAIVCGRFNNSQIQIQLSKISEVDLIINGVKLDLYNALPSEIYIDSAVINIDMKNHLIDISFEEGLSLSVRFSKDALTMMTAATPTLQTTGIVS